MCLWNFNVVYWLTSSFFKKKKSTLVVSFVSVVVWLCVYVRIVSVVVISCDWAIGHWVLLFVGCWMGVALGGC